MRDYVVSRKVEKQCTDKSGEKKDRVYYKAPKIQRLITEKRVRRKALIKRAKTDAYKASKEQKQKYEKLMSQYVKEKKASQAAERKAAEEAKSAEEAVNAAVDARAAEDAKFAKADPGQPI